MFGVLAGGVRRGVLALAGELAGEGEDGGGFADHRIDARVNHMFGR